MPGSMIWQKTVFGNYSTPEGSFDSIVSLDNGWIVALRQIYWRPYYNDETGEYEGGAGDRTIIFDVSKDNGATWSQLCYANNSSYRGISKGGMHAVGNTIAAWWSDAYDNLWSTWFDASTVGNVHVGVARANMYPSMALGNKSYLATNGRLLLIEWTETYNEDYSETYPIITHNFIDPWSGNRSSVYIVNGWNQETGYFNPNCALCQRADGNVLIVEAQSKGFGFNWSNPNSGANFNHSGSVTIGSWIGRFALVKSPLSDDMFIVFNADASSSTTTGTQRIWRSSDGVTWNAGDIVEDPFATRLPVHAIEINRNVITVYSKSTSNNNTIQKRDIVWNGGNSYSFGEITTIVTETASPYTSVTINASTYQRDAGRGKNAGILYSSSGNSGSNYYTKWSYTGILNNAPPNAPTPYSPGHNTTYNDNAVPVVSWGFSDPDAGNYQSRWAVHILDHNSNAVIRDTGWVEGGATSWAISPALPPGAYRYRIITQDQSGAQSPWSWEPIFYVNGRPNAPTITSPSWGQWLTTSTPTISWNYSDPDAGSYQSGFYVDLINSSYSAVLWSSGWINSGATSYTMPAIGDGTYYVRVQVKDQHGYINASNGNGPDTAFGNIYFGVDVNAPYAAGPDGTSYSNAANGYRKHLYGVGDNIGVQRVNFWDWHADGGWIDRGAGVNNGDGTWYYDFPYRGDGQYQVDARVYDWAGNVSNGNTAYTSYHIIDRQNPGPGVVDPHKYLNTSNGTHRIHTTGWDGGVSGIRNANAYWSKDGGASWNGPHAASPWDNGQPGADFFYDFPLNQGDGVYTVRFWVYDNANNGAYLDTSYTVDTGLPTIASVSSTVYQKNNGATVSSRVFGVTDGLSGVSHVTTHLVRPDGSWFSYNNAVHEGNGTWRIDMGWNGDQQGSWSIDFRAVDNAGNVSEMIRAYAMVDSTPPSIASVQGYGYENRTSGNRRVWAYGVSDAHAGVKTVHASFAYPGSGRASIQAYQSGSDWYVDVPLSAVQGEWNVQFQAEDHCGNYSSAPISYFFVDSERANDPKPSVVWTTTTASFTWSQFSDPYPSSGRKTTDMYLGEWNGTSYVGTPIYSGTDIGDVTSLQVSNLKPGTRYRYTVTYHDMAGNESAFTYNEFVTKKKIGEYRLQKSGQTLAIPVYDPASGVLGSKALRIQTNSGNGCFELVPISDANASPLRVATSQGIRAISR